MTVSRQSLIILGLGIFSLGILFFSFVQTRTQPVKTDRKRYSMAEIVARTSSAKKRSDTNELPSEGVVSATTVATVAASTDFSKMSDAEFEAYLKSRDGFSTASEAGNYALLQKVLSDNDPCAFRRYKFGFADQVRALMNTADSVVVDGSTDQALIDLFDTDPGSSETFATRNAERSEINTFMNALYFSGQIGGGNAVERDDAYALALFETLASGDPENGAYDYFSTIPMKRLGASEDEIKLRFRSMFQKSAFDTFMPKLMRRVYQKSLTDASHFVLGTQINRNLPVPAMLGPKQLLDDLLKQNDSQFNTEAQSFGRLLMREIPTDTQLKYGTLYWNYLQYAIGASIGNRAWPSGQTPNPFREASDYGHKLRDRMYSLIDKDGEDYITMFNPKACDVSGLEEHTQRRKRNYLQDLPLLEP